ncbi:MAG: hypothetical protein QOF73_914 [Thermomicrobiales bacterium]|nr:hypothetical protein [Thermomicrobiales bacterium]
MHKLLPLTLLLSVLLPVAVAAAPRAAETTDVSIISADIRTGQALAGACYIILDWSNESCDENLDGQVDFADVHLGTFAVIETRAPRDYNRVLGIKITVTAGGNVQLFSVNYRRM